MSEWVKCTDCNGKGKYLTKKGEEYVCPCCDGKGKILLCPHHGGECMLDPKVDNFQHYGWWCDECGGIVDEDDMVMSRSLK